MSDLIAGNRPAELSSRPTLPGLEDPVHNPRHFKFWMLLHELVGSAIYLCLAKPVNHEPNSYVREFDAIIEISPLAIQAEYHGQPEPTISPIFDLGRRTHGGETT